MNIAGDMLDVLIDFIEPLGDAADVAVSKLLLDMVLEAAPETVAPLVPLITDIGGAAVAAVDVARALGPSPSPTAVSTAVVACIDIIKMVGRLPDDIAALPGISAAQVEAFAGAVARRLFDALAVNLLAKRNRLALEALKTVGLITPVPVGTQPPPAGTGSPSARRRAVWRVQWERLESLLTDPGQLIMDAHGGANFDSRSLLADIMGVVALANLPLGRTYDDDEAEDVLGREPDERSIYDITLLAAVDPANSSARTSAGFRLTAVPAAGSDKSGIALVPFATGNARMTGAPMPGWSSGIDAAADLTSGSLGLVWRPPYKIDIANGIGGLPPTPLDGTIGMHLRRGRLDGPFIRLAGADGKTRLEYKALTFEGRAQLAPTELILGAAWDGLRMVIVPDDQFLRRILPGDGLIVDCGVALDVSSLAGVKFRGGAGLDVTLQINELIGNAVRIDSVRVVAGATQGGLVASVGVVFAVLIGDEREVTLTVNGLGLRAGLIPLLQTNSGNLGPLDAYLRPRAPSAVGIAIKAKCIEGGGFLSFDYDHQLYTGAIQLQVKEPSLSLGAIGMLNTRMPDGSDGFSLLAIIDAAFPPIQLGAGFALNAVGGLIGIHRGVDTAVLAAGLKTGALESVMFPRDPVANAPTLLAMLARIFPPVDGRFVVGPMVKIGWGDKKVELSVALILDLPAPIRLMILGRMDVRLPRANPTVILQLDILGVIDFDRREATLDAALVNSRIGSFPISGGMAARLSWGERQEFLLAIGGFNPRFAIPPGFRTPDRLSIVLAEQSDRHFRIQAYIAVTSNSVQLGARADFMCRASTAIGTFGITAYLGFDTLVQFSPFRFTCDIAASIAISLDDTPLLLARLEASLTGPGEWHLTGTVELQIVVKVRLAFDQRFGQPEEATEELADVRSLLLAEIEKPENWAALPVDGSSSVFVCRAATENRPSPMHPIGRFALRERIVPLRKEIRRFGSARLSHGPETYRLTSLAVGAFASTTFEEVLDVFAPGQFDDLTDDERLSRPSFEAMSAGGQLGVTALRLPAVTQGGQPGLVVSLDQFDDTIIDEASPQGSAPEKELGRPSRDLTLLLTETRAPVRPHQLVSILPERYVVADARTLCTLGEASDGVSHAEASDARRRVLAARDTVVAFVYEAA